MSSSSLLSWISISSLQIYQAEDLSWHDLPKIEISPSSMAAELRTSFPNRADKHPAREGAGIGWHLSPCK